MKIVRASPSDRDAAWAINQEYLDSFDIVVREDAAAFDQYFKRDGGFWLAMDGDVVAGCIALRRLPGLGCEVKRLFVRPEFRGRQLADRLLDALERYAAEVGYKTIYLDTKDDLQTAIRFYHRRGYVDCNRYNDNPQATVFMRRSIGEEPHIL